MKHQGYTFYTCSRCPASTDGGADGTIGRPGWVRIDKDNVLCPRCSKDIKRTSAQIRFEVECWGSRGSNALKKKETRPGDMRMGSLMHESNISTATIMIKPSDMSREHMCLRLDLRNGKAIMMLAAPAYYYRELGYIGTRSWLELDEQCNVVLSDRTVRPCRG